MMLKRKEVRLGLAIGGVLLAVVVVYVLVVTAGPDKPQTVTLDQNQGEPAQGQRTQPPAPREDPPTVGTGTSSPVASQNQTPATDPWSTALATGHVPQVPVMLTETPAPTGAAPAPGSTLAQPVPAEANQPTPAPSAGTLVTSVPIAASNVGASIASPGSTGPDRLTSPLLPTSRALETSSPRTHVVRDGESFATIAAAVYGNSSYYPHLIRANPTLDPRKLRAGMTITVPPVSEVRVEPSARPAASVTPATPLDSKTEYRVVDGDSLERIALRLYGKRDRVDKLYELNKSTIGPDPARLKVGMVLKLPEAPSSASR